MGKHIYIFFFVQFRFDQGLSVTRSTPGMILFEYTGLLLFLPEAKTAATNLSFSFSFFLFYFILFFSQKRKESHCGARRMLHTQHVWLFCFH